MPNQTTEQAITEARAKLTQATGTQNEAKAKHAYAEAWAAHCAEIDARELAKAKKEQNHA